MTIRRDRLDPATAAIRVAVRAQLAQLPDAVRRVMVAVSGGPDSLALAAAVAFEATKQGIECAGVVVDHGLQNGSDVVAHQAAEAAERLGLTPTDVCRVVVADRGNGPEADARDARYKALTQAAHRRGAGAILLGHTLDDQAETVLLSLARGSGPGGLAGMRPVSWRDGIMLLRPLLEIRREQTIASCAAQGVEPWHDPQNADPRFTRVRVRHEVLPVLETALGPGVAEALARTAALVRDDVDALNAIAEREFENLADTSDASAGHVRLDIAGLSAQQPAVRTRLYRLCAAALGESGLSRVHLAEIDRLVSAWHGQGAIDVPRIRVVRAAGVIDFTSASDSA